MDVKNYFESMFFIIVVVLVWVEVSDLLDRRRQKKKTKALPMLPPQPLAFNNDIEFLHYIISKKISWLNTYILVPKKYIDSEIAREEDLEHYKLQVSIEVKSSLSPSYKEILYKYFTPESLDVYIVEVINDEVTKAILSISKK